MAQSSYKRKNEAVIKGYTSQLIEHVTGLNPGEENFNIAENFIMDNLRNNSYQDTNENDIRREIIALR